MTFVAGLLEIGGRADLRLCEDESELRGEHPICVFRMPEEEFFGKLYWPTEADPYGSAELDQH